MKRKAEEAERDEYPAWMLQEGQNPGLSDELNQRAASSYGDSDGIMSPSVDLGEVVYSDSTGVEHRKKVHMIHAVDTILTDGERVLTIQRKGPPDQDKLAFVGGLVDPVELKEGESSAQIDIREDASRELAEEANGIISKERGEVVGERKIIREPRDIRIISGVPAHFKNVAKYGVEPEDLMLVTTQAVLFKVSSDELDIMQRDFSAGSDARKGSAQLYKIDALLRDKSMGLDHGALLEEAKAHMQQQRIAEVSRASGISTAARVLRASGVEVNTSALAKGHGDRITGMELKKGKGL